VKYLKNASDLEALEWKIHRISNLPYSTSKQPSHKGPGNLLKLVMDAKRSLKVGFHDLRNGTGSLKTAIFNFRRISRHLDTTTAEEDKERKLLQAGCKRVLSNMQNRTSQLLVQTKEQASGVHGGEAVKIAFKKVPE